LPASETPCRNALAEAGIGVPGTRHSCYAYKKYFHGHEPADFEKEEKEEEEEREWEDAPRPIFSTKRSLRLADGEAGIGAEITW